MNLMQGFLVAVIYAVLCFLESWLAYPMCSRPMMVGPLIGLVMGDLQAGIVMGANMELVFMGVVGIGGTNPPDATVGTAVGTAFAIMMGADMEMALALAVPIALLTSAINPIFMSIKTVINPYIDKLIEKGDYKMIERMVAIKSWIGIVPKAIIIMFAVALGANSLNGLLDKIPAFITGGMSVAGGMMAAVGFAMLLRMMWSKKMCVYFFFGFVLAAYMGLPIMAIAFLGIILSVILYFEGSFSNGNTAVAAANDEGEDLFND